VRLEDSLPPNFADWTPTPPGVKYAELAVRLHAWHLDQAVYSAECRWCNPKHVDVMA
jgi:hypothetical protein